MNNVKEKLSLLEFIGYLNKDLDLGVKYAFTFKNVNNKFS